VENRPRKRRLNVAFADRENASFGNDLTNMDGNQKKRVRYNDPSIESKAGKSVIMRGGGGIQIDGRRNNRENTRFGSRKKPIRFETQAVLQPWDEDVLSKELEVPDYAEDIMVN